MKQQEHDKIFEVIQRIEDKLDLLIGQAKEEIKATEKKVYDSKESDIMKKFNEWMINKNPKMDDSVFNNSEGEEDNF